MIYLGIRLMAGAATRVARLAKRAMERLRSLWRRHLASVAGNAGYAAATAAVLAGALGLLPGKEVVAAILAALLGIYLRDTRSPGGAVDGRHSSSYYLD